MASIPIYQYISINPDACKNLLLTCKDILFTFDPIVVKSEILS